MAVEQGCPAPIRLRPVTSAFIGTTAFFRNRALLRVLLQRIAALEATHVSVLVHACSIGAEIWSLLIAAELDAATRDKHLHVTAADIEGEFITYASRGIYPRAVLAGMRPAESAYFEPLDTESVRVCDRLRQRVTMLPPRSVADFEADQSFDVVVLLNALLYVPAEVQSQAIDRLARRNKHLLVTTGFHLDRIKADVQRNGYRPVSDGAREIHDGWSDRRRDAPQPNEMMPGKIFHPWSLPAFSEIADFEYNYCAIFEKLP